MNMNADRDHRRSDHPAQQTPVANAITPGVYASKSPLQVRPLEHKRGSTVEEEVLLLSGGVGVSREAVGKCGIKDEGFKLSPTTPNQEVSRGVQAAEEESAAGSGAMTAEKTSKVSSELARAAQLPIMTRTDAASGMKDEASARIYEIGYRSVLCAEDNSASAWQPTPQVNDAAVPRGAQSVGDSDARPSDDGAPPCWATLRRGLWRPQCEEAGVGSFHGKSLGEDITSESWNWSKGTPDVTAYRQAARRNDPADHPREDPAHTHEVQHGCDYNGEPCEPSHDDLGDIPHASRIGACDNDDDDLQVVGSWPPATCGAFVSAQKANCSSQSFPKCNDTSPLPQRHRDAQQSHSGKAGPSSPTTNVFVPGGGYLEEYKPTPFVARQELEHLAAKRRRKERVRAEDRARRSLSSKGCWMNTTSRAILARCSCDGGSGASSPSPSGGRGEAGGQSVFERLARRRSIHDAQESLMRGREHKDGRRISRFVCDDWEDGAPGGHPFQPTVNPRSIKLASRMPHRNKDSHIFPQQRLHEDGEELLWKREYKAGLVTQALREMSVGPFVSVGSERVLAKRSKSMMVRFRSRLMSLVEIVDTERTGLLSLAGVERVMNECAMLPDQAPQDVRDDVLLAVWAGLSEERGGDVVARDSIGGRGGGHHGVGGSNGDGKGVACGVPVGPLAVLLSEAASKSYGCKMTTSEVRNTPKGLEVRPKPTRRQWKHETEGEGRRPLVGGAFAAMLQGNPQLEPVCKELRDVFEANRRDRNRKHRNVKRSSGNVKVDKLCPHEPPPDEAWSGLTRTGGSRGESSTSMASASVATPVQIAATSARFEEQVRARERKIETLRTAEEARQNAAHPFEPSMVATATPGALAPRTEVAAADQVTASMLSQRQSASNQGICRRVIGQGLQSSSVDLRTTEERDMVENCTFKPRLYEPLPLPPPLYPVHKTRHSATPEQDTADLAQSDGTAVAAAVAAARTPDDRATTAWKTKVDRLKAGRKQRLRRLQEQQASAVRSEPLPPSVQQLFVDAGMETCSREHEHHTGRTSARVPTKLCGSTDRMAGDARRRPPPKRLCRPERSLCAPPRPKGNRSEEHSREQIVGQAVRPQERKLVVAPAYERSAAVVAFEKALSEREHERDLSGLDDDPPLLIAEVEFARRRGWAFLAVWPGTCSREAAGELVKHQRGIASAVAHDLERSLRNEIEHACARTAAVGGKVNRGSTTRKGGQSGKMLRTVPMTVLRVEA